MTLPDHLDEHGRVRHHVEPSVKPIVFVLLAILVGMAIMYAIAHLSVPPDLGTPR